MDSGDPGIRGLSGTKDSSSDGHAQRWIWTCTPPSTPGAAAHEESADFRARISCCAKQEGRRHPKNDGDISSRSQIAEVPTVQPWDNMSSKINSTDYKP